jgi:hypothetical protein
MNGDISLVKEGGKSGSHRDARMLMRVFARMSERLEASTGNPVITFSCNKQFGYYCNGIVRIGCQEHPLEHWLDNYEDICKKLKAKKDDVEYCRIILNVLKRDFALTKKTG